MKKLILLLLLPVFGQLPGFGQSVTKWTQVAQWDDDTLTWIDYSLYDDVRVNGDTIVVFDWQGKAIDTILMSDFSDPMLPNDYEYRENWYEEDMHLLSLLKQYSSECYADSTRHCGWVFVETESFQGGHAGYDQWDCWYVHITPTIDGFIEWLSKRLGE